MAKRPGGVMVQSGGDATRSQLIPVITKWTELSKTAQLGPVIFCIVFFFAMATFEFPRTIAYEIYLPNGYKADPRAWIYTSIFLIMLGIFLTTVSLWFIYRMVGKKKAWYVLLGAACCTGYYLWLFYVDHDFADMYNWFHITLAGGEADPNGHFLQQFLQNFLGTGFFEETVKALPVLALVIAGNFMPPALRSKIGVEEPLDGILIGAASGGGFAIMETLCQYVPQSMVDTWMRAVLNTDSAGANRYMNTLTFAGKQQVIERGYHMFQTYVGIPPLIIRSIDMSFGHMAYAGYFGYFIGLSVLKPEQRWKILGIGLVSASIPHALWDTVLSFDNTPLDAFVALLSYAVLAAAVLKAREISPNRSVLQPSMVFGSVRTLPAYATAPPQPVFAVATPPAGATPPPPPPPPPLRYGLATDAAPHPPLPQSVGPAGSIANRLRVGAKFLVIVPGLRLLEHQVPGLLAGSPGGVVAEVTRNPGDPTVLGLTNLSSSAWEAVSHGARRQVAPGQTIKLSPGAKIDFGSTDGEVG